MTGDELEGRHADGTAAAGGPRRELLTIGIEPAGSVVRALVRGELDESTAPKLISGIRDAVKPGQDVVLDLGGLTFCGSAGLSALILIERQVTEGNGTLEVSRPTPFLVQLLQMAGLDGLIAASEG